MKLHYQSPEAIEIGKADSIILGEKCGEAWDQPTMSFVGCYPTVLDVDE